MFPLLVVASFHLRFEEPPELALDGPPNPVSLLVPALDNVLAVRQDVCIDPRALVDDQLRDLLRLLVLLGLGTLHRPPETVRAPMRVLAESACAHSQPRGVLHPLKLFLAFRGVMLRVLIFTYHGMQLIEV